MADYDPRPLRGRRLNDTAALVAKGICPPQGAYELHSRPSPEAAVTAPEAGGTRDTSMGGRNPAPDGGNTLRRTVDYLDCRKGH